MDMSQIYLIIGIVLLTFEMFTGGFYLFIYFRAFTDFIIQNFVFV